VATHWPSTGRIGIVRGVSSSFEKALSSHFDGPPDNLMLARQQHRKYCETLESLGVDLIHIPEDPEYPDCVFVEDHAVVIGDSFLATKVGHPSRRGESPPIHRLLEEHAYRVNLKDGYIDGGDVIVLENDVLVGHSNRSDAKGILGLKEFCALRSMALHVIDVPKWTLHLKTICSAPTPYLLLCPSGFSQALSPISRNMKVLEVPPDESYSANTIGIGQHTIVAAGYPTVLKHLIQEGLLPLPLEMSQFRAADGSLTCLSIII